HRTYNLGGSHRDHRTVAGVTLDCVYPLSRDHLSFPELMPEFEPHKTLEIYLMQWDNPQLVVDITDVMDLKIRALACHASKFGDFAGVAKRIPERAAALAELRGGRALGGLARARRVLQLRPRAGAGDPDGAPRRRARARFHPARRDRSRGEPRVVPRPRASRPRLLSRLLVTLLRLRAPRTWSRLDRARGRGRSDPGDQPRLEREEPGAGPTAARALPIPDRS